MNEKRIALIGFGEVGKTFAKGFLAAGREVATYDILFDNSATGAALRVYNVMQSEGRRVAAALIAAP